MERIELIFTDRTKKNPSESVKSVSSVYQPKRPHRKSAHAGHLHRHGVEAKTAVRQKLQAGHVFHDEDLLA